MRGHRSKLLAGIILPSQFSGTTRSLSNDGSAYALVAWLCAGVLLAAWLAWFFFSTVTVYETSAKAHLEVMQAPHPVAAMVASRVVSAALMLGQEVRAGEVLVELDSGSEKLRLREEQARLAALAPRIASLKREIGALEQAAANEQRAGLAALQAAQFRAREARAGVEFADDNARRLKEESSAGSVAHIEALRALAEARKLSAASLALVADGRRIEQDGLTRAHQGVAQIEGLKRTVLSLQGEIAGAKVAILRLKADIEKHLVRAPIAGRIGDAAGLSAGTYVAAGQKLATVVPRGALIIVAEFNPAAVLGRVHPGQRARLRLDGFPWAQYGTIEASVSRVASEMRDNLVRVELVPALLQPARSAGIVMQHGLPGSVEVSLEQAAPAVLLLRTSGQWLARAEVQASPAGEPQP
jgi:membrane fusion protein, adhesin transport system